MNIVIIGMKHCGKSTQGRRLAKSLNCSFYDSDDLMTETFQKENGAQLTAKEIFAKHGADKFKSVESDTIYSFIDFIKTSSPDNSVISLGGATPINGTLLEDLKRETSAFVIFLNPAPDTLFERVKRNGPSRFLKGENPEEDFLKTYHERLPYYRKHVDLEIGKELSTLDEIGNAIINCIKAELKA